MKTETELWKEVAECWWFYVNTGNHALKQFDERVIKLTSKGLCRTLILKSLDDAVYGKAYDRLHAYIRDNPEEFSKDYDGTNLIFPETHHYAKQRALIATILFERCEKEIS